jgi:transcriptional regulator with XRE-family HTH domain
MADAAKKPRESRRSDGGELKFDISRARLVRRGPSRPARFSLRALRESAGKTQAQVSRASGLAQPDVSKLENADSLDDRQVSTLRRYLAALGDELEIVAISKFGHRIGLVAGTGASGDQAEHVRRASRPVGPEPLPGDYALSGATPNAPRADDFTNAAAMLIVGKPWGEEMMGVPWTPDQGRALRVCMEIAAMFGKGPGLSEAERFALDRMAAASRPSGTGERQSVDALALMRVKEAKHRYAAAKTGGAQGLAALVLVGDLAECFTGVGALSSREGIEYVMKLLGGKYGPPRTLAQIKKRVGWVDDSRATDVDHIEQGIRKAYRRKRPR